MFLIDGNKLTLTRGNTAFIEIELFKDDEPYVMKTGDSLTLSLKRKNDYNNVLLTKTSTTNTITIVENDTKDLSCGEYDYDITFRGNDGIIDTLFYDTFVLGGECHYDNGKY